MTFKEKWAEQLRAGALEIAEKAEDIIGDLTGNAEIFVGIRLTSDNEAFAYPTIEIQRVLHSHEMWKVKLEQYNGIMMEKRSKTDDQSRKGDLRD